MLDLEIVIYRDTRFKSRAESGGLEIFHDFRVLRSRVKKSLQIYFVVTRFKQLFKVNNSLDEYFEAHDYFFSKPFGFERATLSSFRDRDSELDDPLATRLVLKASAFLLGLPDPLPLPEIAAELLDEDLKAVGLIELSSKFEANALDSDRISSLGTKLFEFWKEKILFVGFCRSLSSVTVRLPARRRLPENCYFETLLVVGPQTASMKDLNLSEVTKVICLYANEHICLLDKPFAASVIATYLKSTERDRPVGGNYLKLPKNLPRSEAAAERRKEKEAKRKKNRADSKVKLCKCPTCTSSTFDDNMSKAGPERLCVAPLCARELLQLMGLASSENLKIIDRMCELSIASMDIESMTLQLDLNPPNSAKSFPYAEIDSAQLGGHFKKVQKPIMISHVDALTFHLPASERLTLTASTDEESSFYEMIKLYWNRVVALQDACRKEKTRISKPITDVIATYQKVYFEEANKWHSENSRVDSNSDRVFVEDRAAVTKALEETHSMAALARGWWQLIPGQLEAQLNRMKRDYNIFSFYG